MTISAVIPAITFSGSSGAGTLGPFSLIKSGTPINFTANSQIKVYRYASVTDLSPDLLVEDTDYTLTGGPTTGSITLTSPQTGLLTAERLHVYREQPYTQNLDLVNGGNFSSANIEARLDRLTEMVQEAKRDGQTAIRFSPLSADTIPRTMPLDAVIDKIVYISGTASSPVLATLDSPASLLANITLAAENITNINLVGTDLGGADTIGIVAADLAGDNTIGSVAAALPSLVPALTDIETVATAIDAGAISDLLDGQVGKLATLAAMQAYDTAVSGQVMYLIGRLSAGDGGAGFFRWVTGDQSTNVTNDPAGGVWVAPDSDATGASGAWRRQQAVNNEVDVLWFVATDSDAGRLAGAQAASTYLSVTQSGGTINIPATLNISGNWIIEVSDIKLRGNSNATSFILSSDTDAPCVTFQPTTAGTASGYLDDGAVENLAIGYSSGAVGIAGSVGLWVRMCQRFRSSGLRPVNAEVGLKISGGQLNRFDAFSHTGQANSTGVKIESEAIGGGSYQVAYTIQFNDIMLSGTAADYAFDIASVDGLVINSGYIAFHDNAHIRLLKERSDTIGHIDISNVYFDGVDSALAGGISPANIMTVPSHAYGNAAIYVHFTNCTFANCTGDLWDVQEDIVGMKVSNSTFVNSTGWAVDVNVGAGDWTFIGCKFRNMGTAATYGAMSFAGTIGSVTIIGCDFELNELVDVKLAGTITSAVIMGNTFTGTLTDIDNGATITASKILNNSTATTKYGSFISDLDFSTTGTIKRRTTNGDIFLEPNGSGLVKIANNGLRIGALATVLSGSAEGALFSGNTFQVSRDSNTGGFFRRTGSDGTAVAFYKDTTNVGSISVTGSATAFNTSSDYRQKYGVIDIDPQAATDFLSAYRPRQYTWRETGQLGWGMIAHELQAVNPNAVTGEKDGEELQEVAYADPATITAMITELQSLRREVNELKGA
jgi:hypothetical protein